MDSKIIFCKINLTLPKKVQICYTILALLRQAGEERAPIRVRLHLVIKFAYALE